jgi:branched-subunit amino acid ABC-type transport system permease component
MTRGSFDAQPIVARYPRERFKEGMVQAVFGGVAHTPGTTYGTVWAGIPERLIPGYQSPNVCDVIAASSFPDSASQS